MFGLAARNEKALRKLTVAKKLHLLHFVASDFHGKMLSKRAVAVRKSYTKHAISTKQGITE